MARRDAVGDASTHDLIGQLAVAPVADWSIRAARLLTRQRKDLAHLLWAQPGHCAWSRRISQALGDIHLFQRELLQRHPATPPQTHSLHVHRYLLGNLGVAVPHRG